MINPMFFGPADAQLFGVYYEPQSGASSFEAQPVGKAQPVGVVLCNALPDELGHTSRAVHHLAMMLAQAGFAALRFDYFGTGDSPGDLEEASVERWRADLRCAANELRQRGCARIALVGLRFGATLAALHGGELAGLILWAPCGSGEEYLDERKRRHEAAFADAGFQCPRFPGASSGASFSEVLGHRYPDSLRNEIGALPSPDTSAAHHLPLLRIEATETPAFWASALGLAFVPRPLLQRIVNWSTEAWTS